MLQGLLFANERLRFSAIVDQALSKLLCLCRFVGHLRACTDAVKIRSIPSKCIKDSEEKSGSVQAVEQGALV